MQRSRIQGWRSGVAATVFLLLTISLQVFAQDPQGFFLDDHAPKNATIPTFTELTKPTGVATVHVNADAASVITPVSKYLFGNNSNPYMTQMVDQPALIDHIKTLSPNIIRFPGGNISSVYLWNSPKDQRPAIAPEKIPDASGALQNAGYWYGENSEGWTLSVANYYNMLQMTNSTGIITINYGYARYNTATDPVAAAAHLAAEWVRYDNGRTKFWEIGNESNGTWQAGYRINTATNQDGQPEIITGALYGKHFHVFADSMRKAAEETGATIYIGAQLLQEEPASWWNSTDKNWNTGIFQEAGDDPDYYIIHSYYTPFATNSTAAEILNTAVPVTKSMMDFVTESIDAAGVEQKPLALTEWNIFAEGSKQMASYISGVHAAIVLGELVKNKYGMASRWDLANGWSNGNDHGLFNQGDEPGSPKWNPRAAYYYMYYFQRYIGDQMISSNVTGSTDVLAYASKFNSGEAGIVVVNKGTAEKIIDIRLDNFGFGDRYYVHSLTGGTDNGEFSLKVFVNGAGPANASGGPGNIETLAARSALIGGSIKVAAPPRSVHYILVEGGENVITGTGRLETEKVVVYPNPSRDSFKVDLPGAGFTEFEIRDARGSRVVGGKIAQDQSSLEINTSLPAGMYVLLLHRRKETVTRRIIIE